MEYRNKLVLAPMVRVGTLPFRLLAAEYGADITYGEEIIDHKFLKCERVTNETLGTTDFVERGTDNVVFRTCPQERDRVVFQMGTSDAVRALKAAQIVCNDVAAIDINMGCPKAFSVSGGMGAALLSKPELIHDILTTLRRNLDTTVTCKIRLLNTRQDTVELARRIEKTGVPALAVHGRKVKDRPRDPAKWDEIADVVSALSIPVIANGDVYEYEDFKRIKDATVTTKELYHGLEKFARGEDSDLAKMNLLSASDQTSSGEEDQFSTSDHTSSSGEEDQFSTSDHTSSSDEDDQFRKTILLHQAAKTRNSPKKKHKARGHLYKQEQGKS